MVQENMGAPLTPKLAQALKFIIDEKPFETFEQFRNGEQLKQLAGIPLSVALYLKVQEGYEPELIENSKEVDLARKDIEHFFVKEKLKFTINGKPFVSYIQYITGGEIRKLGNISDEEEIFLKVTPPYEDERIYDTEKVDLALPGKEQFISKPFSVILIVNTRHKPWVKKTISFEEVIILAFGSYDPSPRTVYTVNYSGGFEPKPEGSMIKGSVVQVKNKMNFDVSATNQS